MLKRLVLGVGAVLSLAVAAAAMPLESWDDKIPNAGQRFKVLTEFGSSAVLDRETQLAWEQSPSARLRDWLSARGECVNRSHGGRKGWRLPTVHELGSLLDPTVAQPGPVLPPGHPFSNVQMFFYWSATGFADLPTFAWEVDFRNGNETTDVKTNLNYVWCARGGLNHGDQY